MGEKKKKKGGKAGKGGKGAAASGSDPGGGGSQEPNADDALYRQSTESRMEGLKSRVDQLRADNSRLKQAAAKSEKDTHEFVAYFQSEMEKKDETIAQQGEELQVLRRDVAQQLEEKDAACTTAVEKAREELSQTRSTLEARVKVLDDELAILSEYKRKRDVLQGKLDDATQRLELREAEHRAEVNELEREFIEKKARQQRDTERKIEDMKAKARVDAQHGLDADTRKIIADNKRMRDELKFQLQTCDELQAQGKALGDDNKRLRRNVELAEEKEKGYASRAHFKGNEVTKAKNKTKTLEHTLAETVLELDQFRASSTAQFGRQTEELRLEAAGLKQLVKLKNKELNNLRQLSSVILEQRTETEQFFLEALEQIKKELARERVENHSRSELMYRHQLREAQKHPSTHRFPPIKPATASANAGTGAGNGAGTGAGNGNGSGNGGSAFGNRVSFAKGERIELRELSWSDRERVLRLLFAKINGVMPSNRAEDILRDTVVGEDDDHLSQADHPCGRPSTTFEVSQPLLHDDPHRSFLNSASTMK